MIIQLGPMSAAQRRDWRRGCLLLLVLSAPGVVLLAAIGYGIFALWNAVG